MRSSANSLDLIPELLQRRTATITISSVVLYTRIGGYPEGHIVNNLIPKKFFCVFTKEQKTAPWSSINYFKRGLIEAKSYSLTNTRGRTQIAHTKQVRSVVCIEIGLKN